MKKVYLTLLISFFIDITYGQYQIGIIPRVSPDKSVYQKIGYTEIEVKFGSPAVKNRPVWGGLVPFNKVWRAGANDATTVEFKSDVKINNHTLAGGKYSLFIIPKENNKWTVIFNSVSKQWGAFNYDANQDVLRFEISPRWSKFKTENLTYAIGQTGFKYGALILSWDYLELEIPFETNYLVDFEKEIESRATKQPRHIQWIPYLQGAEHLEELKSNIDLAGKWINEAEDIMSATTEWNKQFYPRDYIKAHLYWIKAKILAWNKDYKEAIQYVDRLKKMENTSFYDKKNEELNIDIQYNFWNSKKQ